MTDKTDPWPRLIVLADTATSALTHDAMRIVTALSDQNNLSRQEVAMLGALMFANACNNVCRAMYRMDAQQGDVCYSTAISLLQIGRDDARGHGTPNQA